MVNETRYFRFKTTENDSFYAINPNPITLEIYDEYLNKIETVDEKFIKLQSDATYYIKLSCRYNSSYKLSVVEVIDDCSDFVQYSKEIAVNKIYFQTLESSTDVDFFKFTTGKSKKYTINQSILRARGTTITLFDENGKQLGFSTNQESSRDRAYHFNSIQAKLKPNTTYYIMVDHHKKYVDRIYLGVDYQLIVVEDNGGVNITKAKETVVKGKTKKLKVTNKIDKSEQSYIQWYSSDTSIATVSKNGTVKGKKPGKVEISYECKLNDFTILSDTCVVTVKSK